MIARLMRSHDAATALVATLTEIGWVLALTVRSRCRR
jgi:hypothetical protein